MADDGMSSVGWVFLRRMKGRVAGRLQCGMHTRCWGQFRFLGWPLSESGISGLIGIFRMAGDRLSSVGRVFLRRMNGRVAGRQTVRDAPAMLGAVQISWVVVV